MFLHNLFRFIPQSPLRRALGLFNRGDFEAAARMLDALIQQGETRGEDLGAYAAEAYLEAARQRDATQDAHGALQLLERAATLCPQFADVQMQLGRLYEQVDRVDAARLAYEAALHVNPRFFEARLSLARLLVDLGESSDAVRHLDEAQRSVPVGAADDLRDLRARVQPDAEGSADSDERLAEVFERLLAGPPSPLQDGIEAARRALRAGENARAIEAVKEILQRHPDYPDLHNLLGVAYDNEEMSDDAVEEFEAALRLNPRYTDARVNLGLTLFHRGHYEEAQRHLRRAEKERPGHALVRTVLAQIEAHSTPR